MRLEDDDFLAIKRNVSVQSRDVVADRVYRKLPWKVSSIAVNAVVDTVRGYAF